MKYTKIRRNIKAISPVISVLLMIAIAVVASLVTYAWVMGYVGFTTNKVGKSIQIQSVNPALGQIYVQNVGNTAVDFKNPCVYVNGTAFSVQFITPLPLNPGKTGEFDLLTAGGATLSLAGDTSTTIKVASEDGTFSQVIQTFP